MDPERTYLRVHARLSGMLSQFLTPRARMTVEHACLVVGFALLCLLIVMHANFVQQPGCSSELSEIGKTEAQLVQIKITGISLWTRTPTKEDIADFGERTRSENSKIPVMDGDGFTTFLVNLWSYWFGSIAKRSRLIFEPRKDDKQILQTHLEKTPDSGVTKSIYDMDTKADTGSLHARHPISIKKLLNESVLHFYIKWNMPIIWFWNTGRDLMKFDGQLWNRAGWCAFFDIMKLFPLPYLDNVKSFRVRWLDNKSNVFEPMYLYTVEKGYFLLPEEAKAQHSIRTINITISAQNSCFGNRWQRLLIKSFVGYDTILINSLLSFSRRGYLYNFQTKEFYDLSHGQDVSAPAKFGDYLVTKCGVLVMSLFVFFTTAMSVAFTLRETQARMLKFTVLLQHHARNQLPTFQLILVHVVESLAFVPVMIGVLFFLFEFYDHHLLAFLVLTLVWLCELFTMIRFLLFSIFHYSCIYAACDPLLLEPV